MCMVFEGQILLPQNEKEELLCVDTDEAYKEMKNIFHGFFNLNEIDFKVLKKRKQKLMKKNKDWGKRSCDEMVEYYSTFKPANWVKLPNSEKQKHSIECVQCP